MVHQAKLPRSFWPAGTNPPEIETFSLTTLKRIIFSYYHLASGSEFWPAGNQSARNKNFFFDSIKKDFLSFLSSGSEFWPAETNPPEIETFYFIASEKELLDNYIVNNFKKSIFKYLHLPVILIVIKNGNPG